MFILGLSLVKSLSCLTDFAHAIPSSRKLLPRPFFGLVNFLSLQVSV